MALLAAGLMPFDAFGSTSEAITPPAKPATSAVSTVPLKKRAIKVSSSDLLWFGSRSERAQPSRVRLAGSGGLLGLCKRAVPAWALGAVAGGSAFLIDFRTG